MIALTRGRKWLNSAIAALLLSSAVVLGACSSNEESTPAAAENYTFEHVDVEQAAQQVLGQVFDDAVLVSDAQVDGATQTVHLMFSALSSDAVVLTSAAESACKELSDLSLESAASRAADEGDEQLSQRLQELMGEGASYADGLGVLYDTYALSLSIDNDEETLGIDGMRQAGDQGSVNWQ